MKTILLYTIGNTQMAQIIQTDLNKNILIIKNKGKQIMKILTFLTIFNLLNLINLMNLDAQVTQEGKFKEVKTAQDVIDNYISAIGGADKIRKIKSETVSGTFKVQGFEGNYMSFRDDTIFVSRAIRKMEGKDTLLQMSLTTKNYAWDYLMGDMRDFTGEELQNKAENMIIGSLGFYLNYKKYGYSAELKGVDSVNGKECYIVLIAKSEKELRTIYFDMKTFYVLRTDRPNGVSMEYDDFKEVKGIIRPFKIIQNSQVELEQLVSEYKFNKAIDPALLVKPTKD
jgi:zinc protease